MVLVAGFISFSGFAEVAAVRTGETIELLVSPQTKVRAADFAIPERSFSRDFLRKFTGFNFYSLLSYQEQSLPVLFLVQNKIAGSSPDFFLQNQKYSSSENSDEPLPELMK